MEVPPTPRGLRDEQIDSDDDDCKSTDSIRIEAVLEWAVEDERLMFRCENDDGADEWYDRSDLMDGGRQQKLVLAFERKNPPPWDLMCPFCNDEGCEECECPDCERPCRFICGVNYGCQKHPVV